MEVQTVIGKMENDETEKATNQLVLTNDSTFIVKQK